MSLLDWICGEGIVSRHQFSSTLVRLVYGPALRLLELWGKSRVPGGQRSVFSHVRVQPDPGPHPVEVSDPLCSICLVMKLE